MQKKIILPILFLQIHTAHTMEEYSLSRKDFIQVSVEHAANEYLSCQDKVPASRDASTPEYYDAALKKCAEALKNLQTARSEQICEILLPLLNTQRRKQLHKLHPVKMLKRILGTEQLKQDVLSKVFTYPKISFMCEDRKGNKDTTTFQQVDKSTLLLFNKKMPLKVFYFDNHLNNIILDNDGAYKFNVDLSKYRSTKKEEELSKNNESIFPVILFIQNNNKIPQQRVTQIDQTTISINGTQKKYHSIQNIAFLFNDSKKQGCIVEVNYGKTKD